MITPRRIDTSPRTLGLLGLLGAACGPTAPQGPGDDGTGTGTGTGTDPTGSSDPTDPTSPTTTEPPRECDDYNDCDDMYCGYCNVDGKCEEGVGCCGVAGVAVPKEGGKGWRCLPPYECYVDRDCGEGYDCDYGRCVAIAVLQLPPCRPLALDVSQWNLGAPSSGLVLADLDGDGDLDLASAAPSVAGIELLLNDGLGVFSPTESLELGAPTGDIALAAGDLDSDGDLDLVAVRGGTPGELFLVFGQDAVFTVEQVVPTQDDPRQVFIADLDKDGRADVAVTGGGLTEHLGDGVGGFTPGFEPGKIEEITGPVALVDTALDGFPDLIAPLAADPIVKVWAGSAQGFVEIFAIDSLGVNAAGLAGDFDEVVAPELVFTSNVGETGLAQVVAADAPGQWSSQVGRFGASVPLLGGTLAAFGPEPGADLISATGSASVAVLVGDGKSGFICERVLPTAGPTASALTVTGDIDSDGDLDVVAARTDGLEVTVLRP